MISLIFLLSLTLSSGSESFEPHRGYFRLHWVDPIHTSKKFVKENSFPENDRINIESWRIVAFPLIAVYLLGVKRPP